MDAQHQQLIKIINELHEALRTGKGKQEISVIVDQMIDYSQRQGHQVAKI